MDLGRAAVSAWERLVGRELPVMPPAVCPRKYFHVGGSAAETARNIMGHEQLFRVGIACNLLYCICLVIALTALYVILSPVNRNLALFGALCILVYASMWVLMTLNVLDALRLLSGADYLRAFEIDRLQALARRSLPLRRV